METLRRHYARTLRIWATTTSRTPNACSNWSATINSVSGVYRAGCALAFEHDDLAVYQIVGGRAGLPAQALPWSRGYMYGDHERASADADR